MNMSRETNILNKNNIYAIAVGDRFKQNKDACYLLYAPLANKFQLVLPEQVSALSQQLENGIDVNDVFKPFLEVPELKSASSDISTESFCTLHLLLNEKCNFHCHYCYSAKGRSKAELTMEVIQTMLDYFLSEERKAVNDRTIMFMGGGEPVMSYKLLEEATYYAEQITDGTSVKPHFSLTTNGSLLSDSIIEFLKEHNFTVQVSFEILPDVQKSQRGSYDAVASNILKLGKSQVTHYVRSTITEMNVNRICEMVEYAHSMFPDLNKLSCQQVVDPEYFTTVDVVNKFFNDYFDSFNSARKLADRYGITLRSSSSHLINYSKRDRFCYNLLCLTPYNTLTLCPDVSSPNEPDYNNSLVGQVADHSVNFNQEAFAKLSSSTIHSISKCRDCYARWNCGSGCPSSRRVYRPEIFDSICDYYRRMLTESLLEALTIKYQQSTHRNLYDDITEKLCPVNK
jgi:radical SAM protein with 4Fe4S-binding SPASM domain